MEKKSKQNNSCFLFSRKIKMKLSKRPCPSLRDTKKSFIKFIKPFLKNKSDTEFHEELIDEFIRGEGKILQSRLQRLTNTNESWYHNLQINLHLKNKNPLPFNSNYFIVFELFFKDQIDAFANIILSSIFLKNIIKEKKRENINENDFMKYKYLFHSSRIPDYLNDKDKIKTFDYNENNYVIVLYKNVFWLLEANLDYDYLSKQILYITSLEIGEKKENFIGVLTAADRGNWGKFREYFFNLSDKNKEFLNCIERAMMIFCLNDSIYERLNKNEILETMWFNDLQNRYSDKILQIVIFKAGYVGFNMEKSVLDIDIAVHFFKFIQNLNGKRDTNNKPLSLAGSQVRKADTKNDLKKLQMESIQQNNYFENYNYNPVKIDYDLDTELKKNIQETIKEHENLPYKNLNFDIFHFRSFGKNVIERKGFDLNSFIQLAILSTHYRISGKIVASRMFLTNKNFRYSTVDFVRTTIKESVNFMVSLNELRIPRELKIKLGQDFFKQNKNNILDVLNGKNMDVHFLALNSQRDINDKENPIFEDNTFAESSDFFIETYPITNENVKLCVQGFSNEIEGMSITFEARKDHIQFNILSYCDTNKFMEILEEVLLEMKELFLMKEKYYQAKF